MFSEQDVDRELRAALSVSPSPDFEARVLQRIERDAPSRWTPRYAWLAAAASVVVAAGALYGLNRTPDLVGPTASPTVDHRTPPVPIQQREPSVHRGPSVQREPSAHAVTSESPRPETVRVSRRPARSAPRSGEPVVLVAPNQMEALRRLVRAVNEGRIQAPAEPVAGPMPPPASLAVAPLVIEPIPLPPIDPAAEARARSIRDKQ